MANASELSPQPDTLLMTTIGDTFLYWWKTAAFDMYRLDLSSNPTSATPMDTSSPQLEKRGLESRY